MKKLLHIVTTVTLLIFPYTNFAQPTLGTTANFVLFTSVGAVGNTGTSQFTGDVGTNNGAITGFGNVNGVMHNGDGVAGTAVADLLDLYNEINATIATDAHAPLLGGGEILTAGVYAIAGNTVLDQTLILDGENNPGAVFIFKISAPFSVNASSQVSLINDAQACNVFWQVEGLVSLGSLSTVRGTVIANNAAIDMAAGVTLEGRALSTAGAITINGVLAYLPTGCGSVVLNGPAAPPLASTACYGIFSSNGEVTNDGITNVVGDVGTNVGLTTGYDPLAVTGMIHPVPDLSTAAAAADLLVVYDHLNLLSPDIELLYPEQLGNNLVLTPHTYLMNAAATLTGTLYLDARDNPGAVFVLKVNGVLSASTLSNVVLINQAQANNVFWKVEGAVNLYVDADFKGTIISNNGAINMYTGVALEGRALTTDGAFNTFAVATTMSLAECNAVLPVSWLYFRGKAERENVFLEWATTSEANNDFFTIEKSIDGIKFEIVTTVNASEIIGTADLRYSFKDNQPYSLGYYRISQTDKDGQKKYFNTIKVKMEINKSLKVKQYVQGNYINIQITGATTGNGSIELYSMEGKKMLSQKILLTNELNTYKIGKPLHAGIYLIHVKNQNGKIYAGKIMIP